MDLTAGGRSVIQSRWLGKTNYQEALSVQESLFESDENYLLLQEHNHVFTVGIRGSDNFLVPTDELGAEVLQVRRGGEVTYHGPGQLVGYPIISLAEPGPTGSKSYVEALQGLIQHVLAEVGLETILVESEPGVWVDGDVPEKVAAIGVRVSGGRTMHGFAINVSTDLDWFSKIVPCGIVDKGVTSLQAQGIDSTIEQITELIETHAEAYLLPGATIQPNNEVHKSTKVDLSPFSLGAGPGDVVKPSKPENSGVSVRLKSRLDQAGVSEGLEITERKPDWMRVKLSTGEKYKQLKKTTKDLGLTTVCEEAGCPNIYECWNEGTATFMLLGERCTRACGFCLVDTNKPGAVDLDEPKKVAATIKQMGIDFAVLTMVARDDLADGGASIVSETIKAIHREVPGVGVEVLISDLAGSAESLQTVCKAEPEVLNHNVETVPRLQRAVRPAAGYLRSLGVLSRAKQQGMVTKSGLILGMGETIDEVKLTLIDLASIGVDIVTIGQYLRPTTNHLPIARWVEPHEFEKLKEFGESVGIGHIEASPLTRSSHHAGSVFDSLRAESLVP